MSEKIILAKKCENCCPNPNCNNDDPDNMEWGHKEFQDNVIYQDATCNKCGTEFREFYEYCETEWEVDYIDWSTVYEDGVCPDCQKEIPKDAPDGGECENCGHVFCLPEEVQVKR